MSIKSGLTPAQEIAFDRIIDELGHTLDPQFQDFVTIVLTRQLDGNPGQIAWTMRGTVQPDNVPAFLAAAIVDVTDAAEDEIDIFRRALPGKH